MPSSRDKLQHVRELVAADRLDAAKALLQRQITQSPRDPAANNLLSAILARQGQNESARFYAERACEAAPNQPVLLQTLGNLQVLTGQKREGLATLRRAAATAPRDPDLRFALANALVASGQLSEGVVECQLTERDGAGSPDLCQLHAGTLAALGRVDDAIAVLESGGARWPTHPQLVSHAACLHNYSSQVSPSETLAVHKRYGDILNKGLKPLPPLAPPHDPEKQLRVGLLSSDLRQHSISYFLEPLLTNLDRAHFEVVCYHTGLTVDEVSQRLRALTSGWRHLPRVLPTPLATTIREDQIDILIDLSGHTDGHRLPAVHVCAPPLRMTWLGYPNTTGLAAVDSRIVDSITDPPGSEALATEQLPRLDPCFLCYRPPSPAPPVAIRSPTAPIVFGCFGTMQKVGAQCIALWTGVLAATPGSRLLLKNRALSEPDVRDALLSRLTAAGVAADRVDLRTWAPSTADHLRAYDEVDVALDTSPYNGTTTTCEALFMGIPVVTLAGPVHASRVGASLLHAAGLGSLVAQEPDHYSAIAAALAKDRNALATLRAGLRDRLLTSVLCDEKAFADRFGALLRTAWRGEMPPARVSYMSLV